MGGKKRKIKIEKIESKSAKMVAFTKRRNGLFRKASDLCLLSPSTQIAILATPPSSNSHASFYSFGHSSVDHVVSCLLHNKSPLPTKNQENNSGVGFWWEDQRFDSLENVDELKEAIDAVKRTLNNVRLRLDDQVKSKQRDERALVIHQENDIQLQNMEEMNKNEEDTTNQLTVFEATSGSESFLEIENSILRNDERALVIYQENDIQLQNMEMNNNEEDTTNQLTVFEATASSESFLEIENSILRNDERALVIHQENDTQFQNMEMNNNEEETTNQLTVFEATAGSESFLEIENSILCNDDYFTDFNFDQF